jgi:hypothetical protein
MILSLLELTLWLKESRLAPEGTESTETAPLLSVSSVADFGDSKLAVGKLRVLMQVATPGNRLAFNVS